MGPLLEQRGVDQGEVRVCVHGEVLVEFRRLWLEEGGGGGGRGGGDVQQLVVYRSSLLVFM